MWGGLGKQSSSILDWNCPQFHNLFASAPCQWLIIEP
jgi:hypothetical protein